MIDLDELDELDEFDPDTADLLRRSSEALPANRITASIARAELSQHAMARMAASRLAAIDDTLTAAADFPTVFVGEQHADHAVAVEFATRAAVAELATALTISENSVRCQAYEASTLRQRTPRVWAAFRQGEVVYEVARAIAEQARRVPDDADLLERFEDAVLPIAERLPAPAVRRRARTIADRLGSARLVERHHEACDQRRVHLEPSDDGMAWLSIHLTAPDAYRARARIDAAARHLIASHGETRTLSQLRADIASQLLTGDGTAAQVRATVSVTVPVLTAMGTSQEAGSLDGYGPIDADTARRLAADAPSFFRILTHPVSGAVLDVDRTRYRVPADLRRHVEARDRGCVFPGCTRAAGDCDIDHSVAWEDGGATAEANLSCLCRAHHRLKHGSRWELQHEPDGRISWRSPTGRRHDVDPPPF